MEFRFNDEQAQLRDVVARFCRDKAPSSAIRRVMATDTGHDHDAWRQMGAELGLIALHVPEEQGGLGFGAVELGIVMEELGRSLLPVPYLSSVLATSALAEIEDPAVREPLMASVTDGSKLATLVLDSASGYPVSGELRVQDDRLTGTARAVLDGHRADLLLVVVRAANAVRAAHAPTLFVVDAASSGVTKRPLQVMDRTRRFAELRFEQVAAARLDTLDDGQVERIYDTALVALANEMAGGAQALLDATVAYTRTRVQFGRAIGSFQAIKHRLADLLVDVELAKVAGYQAAAALAAGEDASANASLAKFVTADAYMGAAREAIQLHGGIGFTWEHDTHLWYRRAKSSEVFLGTPAWHRERMIREMTA